MKVTRFASKGALDSSLSSLCNVLDILKCIDEIPPPRGEVKGHFFFFFIKGKIIQSIMLSHFTRVSRMKSLDRFGEFSLEKRDFSISFIFTND